jgi:hypothetical protein
MEENGEDHTKLRAVSSQLRISRGRELNIGGGHIVAAWSCGPAEDEFVMESESWPQVILDHHSDTKLSGVVLTQCNDFLNGPRFKLKVMIGIRS